MSIGAALTAYQALSGGGGVAGITGGAAPKQMDFSPTSPINVAPVGVNLGEIIKGYEQGGVTNGGSGARLPSRYASQYVSGNNNIPADSKEDGNNTLIIVGAVSAATLGLFYFIFKRRG